MTVTECAGSDEHLLATAMALCVDAVHDPETDTVHWMDSNMRGKKVKGIRYGIVQFDEVKSIQWWAECFCKKTRGATLYRLRDDIVYAADVK